MTDNVQLAYGGTIAASYTYDGNGRLDVATIGGVAADHGFDGAGNLTSIVSGGATTAFLYDSANRLTQKNLNGVVNTKYKWNASYGWRTSQGPSDASQPVTYTYTATGRLATYGDATRSLTATYSYDAAGQRTRAVVTQSGTTTTTDYKYDGLTLLGFTATQGSASWRLDYLYDEDGAPYGAVYRDPASSATATVFAVLTTDRGDVVALIDTAGSSFCAYRYDAWGVPTSTTTQATGLINSTLAANIAARQLLRYASYCYDSESALYYCSARSYDPATRQWLSRDPAEADGEESAYQYCGGNPVLTSDPTGLYIEDANHRPPLQARAIRLARSLIGKVGRMVWQWYGGETNLGGKWCPNEAWCADFVSFVYDKAGSRAFAPGRYFNVNTLYANAMPEKGMRRVTIPRAGDIVLYDFGGSNGSRLDHTGIVSDPKSHTTIEGNTGCQDGKHPSYTYNGKTYRRFIERKTRSGVHWGGVSGPKFVRVTK